MQKTNTTKYLGVSLILGWCLFSILFQFGKNKTVEASLTIPSTKTSTSIQKNSVTNGKPVTQTATTASSFPMIPIPTTTETATIQIQKFYVDPNNNAHTQTQAWVSSHPEDKAILAKIADEPQASWFGGWNADIKADVERITKNALLINSVPIMVIYSIPNRDCGSYSQGGSESNDAYLQWIQSFTDGLGGRPALIILEPDATSQTQCLSQVQADARYSLLKSALGRLKTDANVKVYIDAGNSHWISAGEMASRLIKSGIEIADGFSLNISNFYSTEDSTVYGTTLSSLLNGKHFVIDTSRNGNVSGAENGWCNPQGRALGQQPTTNTGNTLIDAYLWIKTPGESDGNCNGGPNAGTWWMDYALGLARRANY